MAAARWSRGCGGAVITEKSLSRASDPRLTSAESTSHRALGSSPCCYYCTAGSALTAAATAEGKRGHTMPIEGLGRGHQPSHGKNSFTAPCSHLSPIMRGLVGGVGNNIDFRNGWLVPADTSSGWPSGSFPVRRMVATAQLPQL